MKSLKDNGIPESAMGIRLSVRSGKAPGARVAITAKSLFQKEVTVYLPITKKERWFAMLAVAIEMVEDELCWPVHLDYENFTEYFPWSHLEYLDKRLGCISLICHHVPLNIVTAEDIQKIKEEKEKADKKRCMARERYYRRRSTPSTAQAKN